jgi:uncharacterized secreted protein with C-terminal beta-propeller domain
VDGVDEPDIVKTDGGYVYVISGNDIVIISAHGDKRAQIVSRIDMENIPKEMFVNGDRLVVFETLKAKKSDASSDWIQSPPSQQPTTVVEIYDISSRSDPVLVETVLVSGSYVDSRMIGNYVYVMTNQFPRVYGDLNNITLPVIQNDGQVWNVEATEIGYFGAKPSFSSFSFTVVVSVNVLGDEDLRYDVFLTDSAQDMYVSEHNIYATSKFGVGSHVNTTIHKISITKGNIAYKCSNEVKGSILDQFSMDEYKGYLRVATYTGSESNVYVLDQNLNLIGKLEGIAPGEYMHSARMMGDRCYMVTFKKVDPFFVIDLTDPEDPAILGELKIPGYSDYLHPYDENHVIGIGKDTYDMGNFAWYQGVKLSLFDVTDVENPVEVSKFIIGDRGTSTPVLNDHKAFLFSKSKDLLILPVLLAEIDTSKYPDGAPPSTMGDLVWQGAYVFKLTPEAGFELKGKISHLKGEVDGRIYSYRTYMGHVKRALLINNLVYTISEETLKINVVNTLEELAEIGLMEDIEWTDEEPCLIDPVPPIFSLPVTTIPPAPTISLTPAIFPNQVISPAPSQIVSSPIPNPKNDAGPNSISIAPESTQSLTMDSGLIYLVFLAQIFALGLVASTRRNRKGR